MAALYLCPVSAQNSQFLFNNEVLSEIGTFSWYPDQDLAFFCSAGETQHGAGHCIVSSQHCCCSPKEMAYCRRCPKNLVLQLFPPWDFFAFHSFQTLEKPASLARKGLPLFLALTLTFIVTDENIRPLLSVLLIIGVSAANK